MTLRIGVVGYGARGILAAHVADGEVPAKVVAVVDPDATAQERARQDLGGDVACLASPDELLAAGLDGVMVLSPDHLHHQHALALLRAGVPVYCEKPLAITLADCDELLDAAAASGVGLFVGHNMRFMPVVLAMKQAIDDGLIGEVKSVWVRHFVGNGGDYYFKDWHAQRRHTTGLLLQKGAHDIDVIHHLASGNTRRVTAMGALTVYGDVARSVPEAAASDGLTWPPSRQRGLATEIDVEDLSMVLMELDNGVLATYQQCPYTPDYWRNYTVIGTEGRLENRGDEAGAEVHVWNERTPGYRADGNVVLRVDAAEGGHGGADPAIIGAWLDGLRTGRTVSATALAARDAVATAVAATESLRNRSEPRDVARRTDERSAA